MKTSQMSVNLTGLKKVTAEFAGYTIQTDQPKDQGGEGTAPSPFDLFLASIGTCSGYYVDAYCKSRRLPTEDIHLSLQIDSDEKNGMVQNIRIEIHLPHNFPESHKERLIRAADQCFVKKHLDNPPQIETVTVSK